MCRNGLDARRVRLCRALRRSLQVFRVLDELRGNQKLQELESVNLAQQHSVFRLKVGSTNLLQIRGSICFFITRIVSKRFVRQLKEKGKKAIDPPLATAEKKPSFQRTACFPPESFAIVRLGDPGLVGWVPGRGIREDGTVPAVVGARPLAKLGANVHSWAKLVRALGA